MNHLHAVKSKLARLIRRTTTPTIVNRLHAVKSKLAQPTRRMTTAHTATPLFVKRTLPRTFESCTALVPATALIAREVSDDKVVTELVIHMKGKSNSLG